MARKALAWLIAFGLLGGSAGAQGVEEPEREEVEPERYPDDIPDNMEVFRQTPITGETPHPQWEEEEPGTGGAGTAGEVQRGELFGLVERVEGEQLFLRHGGAVFPLELTEETRFTPDRRQVLQPGQEVRARFTLEDGDYVVDALEPVRQAPAGGQSPGQKPGVEQPEAPEQ